MHSWANSVNKSYRVHYCKYMESINFAKGFIALRSYLIRYSQFAFDISNTSNSSPSLLSALTSPTRIHFIRWAVLLLEVALVPVPEPSLVPLTPDLVPDHMRREWVNYYRHSITHNHNLSVKRVMDKLKKKKKHEPWLPDSVYSFLQITKT